VTDRETTRDLLARYLTQRGELGQSEWFLEESTATEFLESLSTHSEQTTAPAVGSGNTSLPAARRPLEVAEVLGGAAGSDAFEALRSQVLSCTLCRLSEGRSTVVFGEGDPGADLLVVGEAPGYEEDRSGRPFVGPAGQLLDKMLAAVGFLRGEVFICNVLKCRPPKNRDPAADEVAACRPYLRRQVELIQPKAICAFGRFASQTLLTTETSLGRLRGTTHDFMGIPVVVTYHPAALLRNAQWKRPAWEDLKLLRRVYDDAGGRAPGGEHA
jgi:DNA polymerase